MGLTTHTHTEAHISIVVIFSDWGRDSWIKKNLFWTKWVWQSTQTEAHISILDWEGILEPQNLIETKLVWLPVLSTVNLSLPLIQEGKLSATCKRMYTEYWLTA